MNEGRSTKIDARRQMHKDQSTKSEDQRPKHENRRKKTKARRLMSEIRVHIYWYFSLHDSVYDKGLFFYETRQKIFKLLGGKIEFEFWIEIMF